DRGAPRDPAAAPAARYRQQRRSDARHAGLRAASRADALTASAQDFDKTRIRQELDLHGEPNRMGVTIEIKPHAHDPVANWERFDGVLPRRLLAFVIDVAIIFAGAAFAAVMIILLGLVTLGFGWWLLTLLYPGTVIWALIYYGSTLGGPASATIGIRAM